MFINYNGDLDEKGKAYSSDFGYLHVRFRVYGVR